MALYVDCDYCGERIVGYWHTLSLNRSDKANYQAKRFAHLHEGCAEALKILIQDHREWFEGQGEDVNARSSQLGENPWRWQLVGPCEEPVRPTAPEFHTPPPPTRPRPSDDTSIWRVGLPSRTRNALLRVGVTTVGELAASSDKDLLAIPNFGPQALREVHEALERREKEPERQEA